MYRLFAYADSSDLHDAAPELVAAFERFAQSWPVQGVRLTNKKAPLMDGQQLPDWNLGLRVETEHLSGENVEALLSFISDLSRTSNLAFVLRTWARPSGTRDLCVIERHVPDGTSVSFWRVPMRSNKAVNTDAQVRPRTTCAPNLVRRLPLR